MDKLHILSTNQTPEFLFNPEGIIKIQGRGLFNDKPEEYNQIINWIDTYQKNPARVTSVTIAFEYLNSLSTIILVSILQNLAQIPRQSKSLLIKWYYEEDDEEILERGKYISFSFAPIKFATCKRAFSKASLDIIPNE